MLILRRTRSVRARLLLSDDLPEPARSTGILGDWYVHLVRFGRDRHVLATSERSLLTLLLPARELRQNLAPKLRSGLGALLAILDAPREAIHREIATMTSIAFARAIDRRVLGSMNDFAFQASVLISRGEHDPLRIGRLLSATPMSAIGLKRGELSFPGGESMLPRSTAVAGSYPAQLPPGPTRCGDRDSRSSRQRRRIPLKAPGACRCDFPLNGTRGAKAVGISGLQSGVKGDSERLA